MMDPIQSGTLRRPNSHCRTPSRLFDGTSAATPGLFDTASQRQDEALMLAAMDLLFESTKDDSATPSSDIDEAYWVDSLDMEELIDRVKSMLEGDGEDGISGVGFEMMEDYSSPESHTSKKTLSSSTLKKLDACFQTCDQKTAREESIAEFVFTEDFVLEEQNASRERRKEARQVEASEENRLAVEVAQLRGLRLKSQQANFDEDLRWKISNAERAYVSRKMVYAKASQVAGSELRMQFARVRAFLEDLHQAQQQVLYRQHRRSLNFQTLMHSLRGSDPRVVSLDTQIAVRLFRKKKSDLNEFHMARTLEEAVFLESMMNVLDKVQRTKETAATELFKQHVQNLKLERKNNEKRQEELELFAASGTLEMAKLVAQYTEEDAEDMEKEDRVQQKVDSIERTKDFDSYKGGSVFSSKLYDAILWTAATNELGLTSSGSSLYSSDYGSDIFVEGDDGEEEQGPAPNTRTAPQDDGYPVEPVEPAYHDMDDHDVRHPPQSLTPLGTMHARQLKKSLREKERAINKKHKKEVRAERKQYQKECLALKAKHQQAIDEMLEASHLERESLREGIDQRMEALAQRQKESTEIMNKKDLELMKQALTAEDQRMEEAEANCFRKAQELISAQVFHEVRNALSSVVAMSDMTNALKNDVSITPNELIGSVDDMLDQIGDVVNYALKMLNEILDVSKINSGAFTPKSESFDLEEIVARATRMQQPKASKINLSFEPSIKPCIAIGDPGIVERIIATMISNAVKFTKAGAVEPFIWPLERVRQKECVESEEAISIGSRSSSRTATTVSSWRSGCDTQSGVDEMPMDTTEKMRFVAVGVADTGHGLTREQLESAKHAISTSTSQTNSHGAQNTGFGLYHAHLQAKALHTHLHLANTADCHSLLNSSMLKAVTTRKTCRISTDGEDETPGPGTILYFVLPIYEDSGGAKKSLENSQVSASLARKVANKTDYLFRPLPPPTPSGGCFRVLVADDVLMLRKGMVHTIGKLWSKRFPHCPVSVSTACTAEDLLRAAQSQPFDLIISDHHFNHDKTKDLPRLEDGIRPHVQFDADDTSPEATRKGVKAFFDQERFTTGDSDGSLLGLNALIQLSKPSSTPFPVPVLMLVSGHKIDIEASLGIIVAQKPLKHCEFVSSLERRATDLLVAGHCKTRDNEERTGGPRIRALVNGHGSQLFVLAKELPPMEPPAT